MPDVEKVIKGLECCIITPDICSDLCPYFGKGDENDYCDEKLFKDAIALLKAQEQEIEDLKQEIEGHKDNLRETLDEMMRYADELKAQEPVKPISCKSYIHTEPITFDYECPICMTGIMRNWVACPICGQAVKWG